MIEIVHLKKGNRTFASVFGLDPTEFYTIKIYKARYTAGLEKPHYPVPTLRDSKSNAHWWRFWWFKRHVLSTMSREEGSLT